MVETYKHLFWDCVYVKPLWQKVTERFDLTELQNAEWKDIHVAIVGKDLDTKCCNTIIFILKSLFFDIGRRVQFLLLRTFINR